MKILINNKQNNFLSSKIIRHVPKQNSQQHGFLFPILRTLSRCLSKKYLAFLLFQNSPFLPGEVAEEEEVLEVVGSRVVRLHLEVFHQLPAVVRSEVRAVGHHRVSSDAAGENGELLQREITVIESVLQREQGEFCRVKFQKHRIISLCWCVKV